jgi:uncharacterized protein (TIGR02118 family)
VLQLVFCVNRRSDVDEAEFHRYWRDEHGPLVRSLQAALGVVRYVQAHRIDTPLNDLLRQSRDTQPPYDGVAQLWWESHDHFVACLATPESQAAAATLLEDERRFIDLGSCAIFLAEDSVIIPG